MDYKCETCEDSGEVQVTHYWDANGNEQEFDEGELVSCPKCQREDDKPDAAAEPSLRAES